MEKVKISKSQADAIMFLTSNYPEANIVTDHARCDSKWKWEATGLNNMDVDLLIRALYIGYEVEETPEDKVREYYNKLNRDAIERDREKFAVNTVRYEMEGVLKTLFLLNVKIEGIN